MDRQITQYRGWQLTVFPGRPWVGTAKLVRPPFDVIVVKGFSDWAVMADLRQKVDQIEDAGNRPDATG
jgi:hypothetical protein